MLRLVVLTLVYHASQHHALKITTQSNRFSPDTVMAFALYPESPDVSTLNLKFINSLRGIGFTGRIFLGVSNGTTDRTGYFEKAKVIAKPIENAPCQLPYPNKQKSRRIPGVRLLCTKDYPNLKVESARWAYKLSWLRACSECTGWTLLSDYRDVVFQRPPFTGLTLPAATAPEQRIVYFTEELAVRRDATGETRGISTHYWMTRLGAKSCYGDDAAAFIDGRPMLNVATPIGNRAGMLAYLERFVEHLTWIVSSNNPNAEGCDPTHSSDQGPFNYLVYKGEFPYGKTMVWGRWNVNTMREPCQNRNPNPAGGDRIHHSWTDLVKVENCTVYNEDGTVPPVLHQYMTCTTNYDRPCTGRWVGPNNLVMPSF